MVFFFFITISFLFHTAKVPLHCAKKRARGRIYSILQPIISTIIPFFFKNQKRSPISKIVPINSKIIFCFYRTKSLWKTRRVSWNLFNQFKSYVKNKKGPNYIYHCLWVFTVQSYNKIQELIFDKNILYQTYDRLFFFSQRKDVSLL